MMKQSQCRLQFLAWNCSYSQNPQRYMSFSESQLCIVTVPEETRTAYVWSVPALKHSICSNLLAGLISQFCGRMRFLRPRQAWLLMPPLLPMEPKTKVQFCHTGQFASGRHWHESVAKLLDGQDSEYRTPGGAAGRNAGGDCRSFCQAVSQSQEWRKLQPTARER